MGRALLALWGFSTVAAAGCGGSSHSPGNPDGLSADALGDAASDAPAACAGSGCDLSCDPTDTWLALTRGPGTGLGDAEPASPAEIGDGNWHLFVGNNTSTTDTPDVYIYEAVASAPDAVFALGDAPLAATRDSYDAVGSETPSYLRADADREYIYYCAVESYTAPSSHIAALRRVDGGAWTKIGVVSPNAADELTQCEPNVVRDPSSGMLVMQYLTLTGTRVQERQRTSADPEQFATATMTTTIDSDPAQVFPNRLALSRDPFANVWRTAYDESLGNYAMHTVQVWSVQPSIGAADLARAQTLHDGAHATHLELHTDFTGCDMTSCPQGAVLQPGKAIYPNASDVIFYYSGWNESAAAPQLQVNGQRCQRAM